MIHLLAAHWPLLLMAAVYLAAAVGIAWGEASDTIHAAEVQQRTGRRT